ncbi:ATP-binding protein [Halobacteriales archaeon Cl-PHB]
MQLDVLLVEDNPGDATLIEHHLANPAVDTFVDEVSLTHVETLTAALETLDGGRYDVLLLDLGLPESTGIETLELVLDDDPSVPIIVLTGLDDAQISVDAIQAGAQDFLPKAELDTDRLVRALRYAVERHKQERELQRRTEQIEFFNQILRHDIANGINVINMRGSMLVDRLDGEAADDAQTIVDWSNDMTELTTKIRTILETLTNDERRDLHEIDLAPILERQADRCRSMGEDVSVEVDTPSDLAVWADDLLEDVVGNLLANAAEHAGTDVEVTVTARTASGSVCLTVADDGPGISPDQRDDIFQQGFKGSASGGTGFGLYFVDAMVDSYDGNIEVGRSGAGGTEFVVELERA